MKSGLGVETLRFLLPADVLPGEDDAPLKIPVGRAADLFGCVDQLVTKPLLACRFAKSDASKFEIFPGEGCASWPRRLCYLASVRRLLQPQLRALALRASSPLKNKAPQNNGNQRCRIWVLQNNEKFRQHSKNQPKLMRTCSA